MSPTQRGGGGRGRRLARLTSSRAARPRTPRPTLTSGARSRPTAAALDRHLAHLGIAASDDAASHGTPRAAVAVRSHRVSRHLCRVPRRSTGIDEVEQFTAVGRLLRRIPGIMSTERPFIRPIVRRSWTAARRDSREIGTSQCLIPFILDSSDAAYRLAFTGILGRHQIACKTGTASDKRSITSPLLSVRWALSFVALFFFGASPPFVGFLLARKALRDS
jgi:hypothetical protein